MSDVPGPAWLPGRESYAQYAARKSADEAAAAAAADLGEEFVLPLDHRPEQGVDWDSIEAASLDTPLPASNVGYQLLAKMGWAPGQGLGRCGQGMTAPIRGSADPALRLGLGKQEEDDFWTAAENVTRKRSKAELQAIEDVTGRELREAKAAEQARTAAEVAAIVRTFYCDLCSKQYANAVELQTHISSYDHNHRKRLMEMKAMGRESRDDVMKREEKRLAKEMAATTARAAEAARQAAAEGMGQVAAADNVGPSASVAGVPGGAAAAAEVASVAPDPGLLAPEHRPTVKMGFGGSKPGLAGRPKPKGAAPLRPAVAAFAADDESD